MSTLAGPQGMGREWLAARGMVGQVFRWRASLGGNGFTWTFLVLALALPVLAGAFSGHWARSIGLGAGIPLLFVVFLWWYFLATSLVTQCDAPATRLVPRMRRRAFLLLSGAWLFASLALGLLLSLGFNVKAPVIAAVGIVLAVVSTGSMLGIFCILCVVLYLLGLAGHSVGDLGFATLANVLLLAAPLVAALAGCLLWRRLGWRGVAGNVSAGAGANYFYARRLRNDIQCSDGARLLIHAAGPAVLAPMPSLVAGYGAFLLISTTVFSVDAQVACGFFAAIALLLIFAGAPNMARCIAITPCEQALVRLTPGVPAGEKFNDVLSNALLRQWWRMYWQSSVAAFAFMAAAGASGATLASLAAVFTMALVSASATQRDYAAMLRGRWSEALGMGWFALSVWFALMAFMEKGSAAAWMALAGVSVLVGTAVVYASRRAMLHAPVAFPAGRSA